MNDIIPLKRSNVIKAFKRATPDIRKALQDLVGEEILSENIMDRIKSYEDACFDQNVEPLTIEHFSFLPEEDREYHYYNHQADIIQRALVQGWKSIKSDTSQKKYFATFYWNENRAGGPGLSYGDDGYDFSASGVGARREFPTWELAKYFGTQFLSIHEKLHTL